MLVNGDDAAAWRLDPVAPGSFQFARSGNWLKVSVDSTGLYRISGAELARAGVSLEGLNPVSLEMRGLPERSATVVLPDSMVRVPVYVDGADDGRLDPDDMIVFYALGADHWSRGCSSFSRNLYTTSNAYWLTWGNSQGGGMLSGLQPDTAGAPVVGFGRDVLHLERDMECPARSGLLWIWSTLFKPAERQEAAFTTSFRLPGPLALRRISGRLMADSAGNEVTVVLNRRALAVFSFGPSPPGNPFTFTVDSSVPLSRTVNDLGIVLRGSGGKQVHVDRFSLSYDRRLSLADGQLHFLYDEPGSFRFVVTDVTESPLVIDVTDRAAPRRVLGYEHYRDTVRFCHFRAEPGPRELVVCTRDQLRRPIRLERRYPGSLSAVGHRADYWIVAPGEAHASAAVLAAYRTGRVAGVPGATAVVALLEDIYDDYAFGMAEPVAVKRFLADKRAAYALLVGDGTYDYRNILGRTFPGVPAYEYGFGLNPDAYDRSALAFDAWYADWEGDGGSPDVVLGRITARTPQELRQYVDKVIGYETGPAGYWAKRYILLSDDEFNGQPSRPDPIGFQHMAYCEAMSVLPDNLLDHVKVYLTEYPYMAVKSKPAANAELLRQLNRGGSVLVFFGHGSGFDLTHEGVLNITQVPELANGGRLPFCYFGSCSVGRFDDLLYESIAEELVRHAGGGAIATVAATKATTSGSNLVFARNLLTPLFTEPGSTAGHSFFLAWPTDRIYHFFGDPAVVLRLPARSSQGMLVRPDTLRPGSRLTGSAIVEVGSGLHEWSLYGPRRRRFYQSTQGQVFYGLPGIETSRGSGVVQNGVVECAAFFPAGLSLDTLPVGNGYYAPVPRSCRLSVLVANDSQDLAVLGETLDYALSVPATGDSAGPRVELRRGGKPIRNQDELPSPVALEIVLVDSSGIMLTGVAPGCEPLFFANDRRQATGLSDRLVFDRGSCMTARAELQLDLAGPEDTLWVLAWDNLMNPTVSATVVRSSRGGLLGLDSLLVYPNPARSGCRFTFRMSRAAAVRARVFSLSGRLVADLGWQPAGFGFNSVYWDGRDRSGSVPGNGVYLVSITAQSIDTRGQVQSINVRDRLVVQR